MVIVAVLAWPVTSLMAAANLDNSAMIALSLSVSRGLAYGTQVAFTYGPLGFITHPLAVTGGTVLAGVIGAAAIQLAFVGVVLVGLSRQVGWPLAAVAALVAVSVATTASPLAAGGIPTPLESPLLDIAFGLVALALSAPPRRTARAATGLALAGGALAGLALLVKLNDGVGVTAIVVVGLLGTERPRRTIPLAVLSLAVCGLLAWLALGQPLDSLPDYFRNAVAVVGGNVDALGENAMGAGGQWEVLVVAVSAVFLSVGAWVALTGAPRKRRYALAVAVLLVHYFVAREMFGRYDPVHAAAIILLAPVALMIPWRRRERTAGFAAWTALAVAAVAVLGIGGDSLANVFDPTSRAGALISDVSTVVSPQSEISQAQADIQAAVAVPGQLLTSLNGRCVNVEPYQIALVFANPSWRWCPLPALKSYSAYTTSLDNLDAEAYANPTSGPNAVLRQADGSVDGRNPAWDSPAAMLSLLCHFTETARSGIWQVLMRTKNRCGARRTVETLHSDGASTIAIPSPPPGMVLLAEIHGLQIAGGERLRTVLTRPAIRTITVNGDATYRVVPDTLADGLILDVPATADYAAPFNLDQSAEDLGAQIGGVSAAFSVTLIDVPISAS